MIIIENLSLLSIIKLFFLLFTKRRSMGDSPIYFVDSSKFFKKYERFILSKLSNRIRKLTFKYDDLNDENNTNYGFYKIEDEILDLYNIISFEKYFDNELMKASDKTYIIGYIKKYLLVGNWPSYGFKNSLRNLLLMIKAINNQSQSLGLKSDKVIFIISKRLWINELISIASKYDIDLYPINHPIKRLKQLIFEYVNNNKYVLLCKTFIDSVKTGNVYFWKDKKLSGFQQNPKIMAEQIIRLYRPNEFWEFIKSPNDIVFVDKSHKINQKELNDIKNLGMSFIPLSPYVSEDINAEYFRPDNAVSFTNNCNMLKIREKRISLEEKIVFRNIDKYNRRKEYWKGLFNDTGIKIYMSYDKWSPDAIAASAAIKQIGGISSVVQTSYYEFPTYHSSMYTDIYFSFSPDIKNIELKIESDIKYIVCTGFVYDYYFKNKKKDSKIIRNQLFGNGAKKIICLVDGGSRFDERWSGGVSNYQNDYRFWLEKLIDEDWLGLIIKSKGPGSLRKRLGNVSELLDKAIATGRCYFSDKSTYFDKNLNFRVAQAASASDLTVHFCLYAGSAGLEARLAGVPTLLFDRYGLLNSQFYKLGLNKIVFNDWSKMWKMIKKHFTKGYLPDLGDWSPIINDLDPFQDGKAAYRINTYCNWLLEGFKQGLEKDRIMDQAAERYSSEWGDDKIIYFS